MTERIFLLDGHSLSYRAFFALPETLATSTGQVTNAVYGFTSMLIKLLGDERPDLIAVAFDRGLPTVRLEKFSDYKAARPEPPSAFRGQIGLIKEVLATLEVPIIEVVGHEADDAIATLALRALAEGMDVTVVTADRDFFQLVRPGITVLFNRKGITDIVRYDEAAVEARYGLKPAAYLDFVALKGDPSDNIPNVPGIGEKTASTLIQTYGSVEEVIKHTAELKPKQRENIDAMTDQVLLNKELAAFVTDLDLDVAPEDCRIGQWDMVEIRQLFTSLEFRTLLERLEDVGRSLGSAGAEAAAENTVALELTEGTVLDVTKAIAAKVAKAVVLGTAGSELTSVAVSSGEGRAVAVELSKVSAPLAKGLGDENAAKWAYDAKAGATALQHQGLSLAGVTIDVLLAGYLLASGADGYLLRDLCREYLGTDLLDEVTSATDGQLFSEPWRETAAAAAAVALLAPELQTRLERQGLRSLHDDVELPLTFTLARMQARGIALNTEYLSDLAEGIRAEMETLRTTIYAEAGEEFNLNSPPQLRVILFDKRKLPVGKKTPKGEASTDASVLEKLRLDPLVDSLLRWRELDKLNSTYLVALPKLVDPRDGRIHSTFDQTVAATGRLSSKDPNLQNIPVRSDLGRQVRKAFVPGSPANVLLVADYSQIELRILAHLSGDPGLGEAFAGGHDIHTETASRVFGVPLESVDVELRRRAKAVNYGLAYGMNAWGLAQRLDIAADEGKEIIDAYFESFPGIRSYLEQQVDQAKVDGFTETMLGRRRYIPELQASNRGLQDLGRRQALNAPIQGSASDVFKLAMLKVEASLDAEPELECQMLLTVHDELVFEVPAAGVERAAVVVKEAMESAVALSVPLIADIGWGPNWADAAPEGH